jgi:4-amino-4-deoxy-L-arabinose transferase-like glycosyltransferase
VSGRAALLALLAAWIALGLLGHDPWKPDEAYTFGLVYHILESGEWLVPTLAGEPFVEKPPLFFWTAALFAKAFGDVMPLHDAARLASAFYVGLTLWFTYLAAGRAIAAPLILAGCLGYLQHAHQLITDNALVAGVAIGLYGLSKKSGLWLGTGAGIAFLSKGLIGPGILGLAAVGLLIFKYWRSRRFLQSWTWALLAFAPWALIWPWLLYRHSPALFHEWFWVNNFGRFSGSAGLGGVLDHWHYAKALPWFALPAWPLAAWTLWKRPGTPEVDLSLAAFLVMFVALSASSSARTLYALPMLVPLALLASVEMDSAPAWIARTLEQLAVWGSAILGLALWGGWIAFVAGWRPAFLEKASPGFVPQVEPALLLAALAVTALCIFALRVEPRLPARWLAGVTLVWGLAMTLWLPWIDHAKSYRGMIADLQRARPKVEGCVASRNLTEPQRALFHYFAGMRTAREGAADCPLLLVHTSSAQPPAMGEGWKLVWQGTRPGDEKESFWLFSR